MARRFKEHKLVIASHNAGKLREIAELLAPFRVEVVSAGELGLPEPEETGTTFRENAAGLPALADDSGLAVAALEGAPGVFSARWAGPDRDFTRAMAKLEAALAEHTTHPQGRSAAFVCALTLAWPDGHAETFEGTVAGHVTWPPRGTRGFGYDPVFVPEGRAETFGEMEPTEKHAMSHRAEAFRQLVAACFARE